MAVEFDRIIHEVGKNLLQQPTICGDSKVFGHAIDHPDPELLNAWRQPVEDFIDEWPQQKGRKRQSDRT